MTILIQYALAYELLVFGECVFVCTSVFDETFPDQHPTQVGREW